MNKKKRKLSRGVIATIVTLALAVVFVSAVLITNIFIPVKYLTAYTVKGNGNARGALRVTFAEVGFGDCALIELPDGKTALIDGGDGSYPTELKVLKLLNKRKVSKIDYLFCTSVKKEHCVGLAEVVKYKNVAHAFIPYCLNSRITDEFHNFSVALKNAGTQITYACAGEGVYGVDYEYFITFLSPADYRSPKSQYAQLNANPTAANIENASSVIWVQYGGTAVAFTSDVRAEGLAQIVEDYRLCKQLNQPYCPVGGYEVDMNYCKVVTVPAHGGEKNTYAPWYDLIKPQQAIISVGKNFADYPSLKALSDVCNYCQPLYTMHNGDITLTVDMGGYKIESAA